MLAVSYCRVSSDSEEQLSSLTNQIKHYSELFKKEGYNIPKTGMFFRKDGKKEIIKYLDNGIFADEGISGTKLKNRKAFEYMIESAKRKEFDVIYVKNVQRWARNVVDGGQALKQLKALGIKVIFEDGNINNWDHEMVINMFLTLAQEESRGKSVAVQFGIRKAQQAGKWTSNRPYGYDLKNGYLKLNEFEQLYVKTIFKLYLNEGYGTGKIARWLNHNNIPTKTGVKWSQAQICGILENAIYTGKQITHREYTNDVNLPRIDARKKVDIKDQIEHQIDELKIIDNEMFERTQIQRKARKDMDIYKQKHSNRTLLSNLLSCGNCGGNMKRKKRKPYIRKDGTNNNLGYEWCCQMNDMYGRDSCLYRNAIPEDDITEHIKQRILRQADQDLLDHYFQEYIDSYYTVDKSSLGTIEDAITAIDQKVNLNFELLSGGIIKKEEYQARNDTLQEELANLHGQRNRIIHIEKKLEIVKLKYKDFCKTLKNIDLNNLTNVELKKIIKKATIISNAYLNETVTQDELDKMGMSRDEHLEFLNKLFWTVNGYAIEIDWQFMDKSIFEMRGWKPLP